MKNSEQTPNEVIIPYENLSPEALYGIIDEFVSRDSSFQDGTLDQKRERVLQELKNNTVVITYSAKAQTTDIKTCEVLSKNR